MTPTPFVSANQRPDQHLHDPDRGPRQPSERPGHAHAPDQGVHARGGELHRQVPTMHHGGLHDVPHHQVIRTRVPETSTETETCSSFKIKPMNSDFIDQLNVGPE